MRTRALSLPRPLPIFILISFALALVLGAVPVDAAPKGSKILPTIDPLNEIVSPGQPAAFETSFTNSGNSTITDLFLNVEAFGGTLTLLPEDCTETGADGTTATCPMGTLSAGAGPFTHLFQVIADTPPAGTIGSVSLTAIYSGDAQQNNTKAAKHDTWPAVPVDPDEETLVDPSAEVFGKWQDGNGPNHAFPQVGGAFQNTNVSVPGAVADGYAALVRHLTGEIDDCTSGPELDGVGLTVELRINDGHSRVEVTLTYSVDATENTSPAQFDLLHQYDDGSCVLVPRDCAVNAGHKDGCFDVRTQGTGQNKLTILEAQLPSNGRIKGG